MGRCRYWKLSIDEVEKLTYDPKKVLLWEKHGGAIDVSSARGKGTTFLIRLSKKTEWEQISKIAEKEKLTDYIVSIGK